MAPPSGRRAKSPSRPKCFGIRRPVMSGRRSILASTSHVDTLAKVQKLLYKDTNEVEGGPSGKQGNPSRIQVAVRVRPLNEREQIANSREIVHVAGKNMIVFDPPVETQEFFFHNKKLKDVTAAKHKNLRFAFDQVYNPEATNEAIFEETMKPMVETLLDGFNCSVFAYGATGSGKTHTMLGSEGNPGLTFLTVNELYRQLEAVAEKFESEIVVSYLEVYNEKVMDLLNPGGELQIRDVGNGIDIANLSYHRPRDVNHVLEMLRLGNSRRSQHPTDHNAESSRSHAVLQVYLNMRERYTDLKTHSRKAKLVMVDLAGSEKGTATGGSGQRFREGASINKSLLALSSCINAMAKGRGFAAFRDSKLTRILKDSLTGKSRTVMIANVSPSHTTLEDTQNTLRYADQAKKIVCKAKQNVMTVQSCLSRYTTVVEEMTARIELLERELKKKDEELQEKDTQFDLHYEPLIAELQLSLALKETELQNALLHRQHYVEVNAAVEQIPNISEVTKLHTTILQAQRFLNHQGVFRLCLLKHMHDLNMKKVKCEIFQSLFEDTGDPRFERGIRKLLKSELESSEETLRQYRTLAGCENGSLEDVWNMNLWKEQVAEDRQMFQVSTEDLYTHYSNQILVMELTREREELQWLLNCVYKKIATQEESLRDAVKAINVFKNLLQHYGHATSTVMDQYDKVLSSYCGMRSVHFDEPKLNMIGINAHPPASPISPSKRPSDSVFNKPTIAKLFADIPKSLRDSILEGDVKELKYDALGCGSGDHLVEEFKRLSDHFNKLRNSTKPEMHLDIPNETNATTVMDSRTELQHSPSTEYHDDANESLVVTNQSDDESVGPESQLVETYHDNIFSPKPFANLLSVNNEGCLPYFSVPQMLEGEEIVNTDAFDEEPLENTFDETTSPTFLPDTREGSPRQRDFSVLSATNVLRLSQPEDRVAYTASSSLERTFTTGAGDAAENMFRLPVPRFTSSVEEFDRLNKDVIPAEPTSTANPKGAKTQLSGGVREQKIVKPTALQRSISPPKIFRSTSSTTAGSSLSSLPRSTSTQSTTRTPYQYPTPGNRLRGVGSTSQLTRRPVKFRKKPFGPAPERKQPD